METPPMDSGEKIGGPASWVGGVEAGPPVVPAATTQHATRPGVRGLHGDKEPSEYLCGGVVQRRVRGQPIQSGHGAQENQP